MRLRSRPGTDTRRGAAALEFVVAAPSLILLFFGGMQFALTSSIANTINAATHEAVRCLQAGGDIDDAATRVDQMLGVHGFGLGPGARLVAQDDSGAIQSRGDGGLTSSTLLTPPPTGTWRALLIVDVSATPAPNMLSGFCLDFSNRRFEASSVGTIDPDCL